MKTEKRCARCGLTKPRAEFYKGNNRPDGMSIYCQPCHIAACNESRFRHPQTARNAGARYRKKYPEQGRERSLKRRYGITIAEYDAMFEAQGGLCKICGSPGPVYNRQKRLQVDHCAHTKTVRGLLCVPCNVAIGHFKHSPELLQEAARYLLLSESRSEG